MTALDFVKALALATYKGPRRVAMCPVCPDEVLVLTFRWPGAEFYCLACATTFSYVDPRGQAETPELVARIEVANAAFAERFPA